MELKLHQIVIQLETDWFFLREFRDIFCPKQTDKIVHFLNASIPKNVFHIADMFDVEFDVDINQIGDSVSITISLSQQAIIDGATSRKEGRDKVIVEHNCPFDTLLNSYHYAQEIDREIDGRNCAIGMFLIHFK